MSLAQAWSWWWHASNDLDSIVRAMLTIAVVTAWMLLLRYVSRPKVRLPPGPRTWPLFGNLLSLTGNLHEHLTQFALHHGPILRIVLGSKLVVVISSPSLAEDVLKHQDVAFANRDPSVAARIVTYNTSEIAWSSYGPTWRTLRKVCVQELFSPAGLAMLRDARRRVVGRMLARIHSNVGTPVNIREQVFLSILDSAVNMLWGDTLVGEEGRMVAEEFKRLIEELADLVISPNVSDFFPVLTPLDLHGVQRKMRKLLLRFDGIFDFLIKSKAEAGNMGNSFVGILLTLKEDDNQQTPLTLENVKGTLQDLVLAATTTSSSTVEWAMTELLRNPEAMKKAQQELQEVVGTKQPVEESHLAKLPYLRATIKETLRLHPAIPLLIPRRPTSPCKVGGYDVPAGTGIFVNVWGIHRDPKYWTEPLSFDPDRFTTHPDLKYAGGKDFHYIPFGSGRRSCVGFALAERMVGLTVGSLIHSFEWLVPGGERVDNCETFGFVLKRTKPLVAIPEPRRFNPV